MAYPLPEMHQAFSLTAGVIASSDNHLDFRRIAKAVVARWESDTNLKGDYSLEDDCPDDVIHALLCLGASMLVPTKASAAGGAGAVQQIKQDDVQISFSAVSTVNSHYSAQQIQLMAEYNEAVKRNRRLVIV